MKNFLKDNIGLIVFFVFIVFLLVWLSFYLDSHYFSKVELVETKKSQEMCNYIIYFRARGVEHMSYSQLEYPKNWTIDEVFGEISKKGIITCKLKYLILL